jgi:lysophospholipase L1-like esterase
MKQFLFLVPIACMAIGCGKPDVGTGNSNTSIDTMPQSTSKTLSWLALGDSYTIGESVTETERYPYLTAALLKEQNILVGAIKYIAQTGWSTVALQSAISNAELLPNYDIVTLLIGVNDQYQHLDTAGYRTRFTELLNNAVALAGSRVQRVFVLSIPDYSATPFVSAANKERVSQEISWFNAINREITLQKGVVYTDITGLSQQAANDLSLLAADRLHYSAKAHKQWAERLASVITAALK